MSNLKDMSTKELLVVYNEAAKKRGEKQVKRFADHTSALRRTKAILEQKPAAKASAPAKTSTSAPVTSRKMREMHFNFKPDRDGIRQVKNEDSLRGRTVAMLKKGGTLPQVKQLIKVFDHDRGKGNAKTIDRRAYELVRIMHYYLGYGVRKNDKGVITIYTK